MQGWRAEQDHSLPGSDLAVYLCSHTFLLSRTAGGRGLNKTMLSLAATTLSASALAGAYFIATYSKGHRE
eukprot:1124743-Pelagomonas_calceolata.AAC.5